MRARLALSGVEIEICIGHVIVQHLPRDVEWIAKHDDTNAVTLVFASRPAADDPSPIWRGPIGYRSGGESH